MSPFNRPVPPQRSIMVNLRVSEEEARILDTISKRFALKGGRSGVIREALDRYIENLPAEVFTETGQGNQR